MLPCLPWLAKEEVEGVRDERERGARADVFVATTRSRERKRGEVGTGKGGKRVQELEVVLGCSRTSQAR